LTISSLLEQLEAQGPGVAVELNEQVIPRLQHPDTLIEPGDRIEVVRLVGGG
jgi:sulfur carrier protein